MKQFRVYASRLVLCGAIFFIFCSCPMDSPVSDSSDVDDKRDIGLVLNRATGRAASLVRSITRDDTQVDLILRYSGRCPCEYANARLHGGVPGIDVADKVRDAGRLTVQQQAALEHDAQLHCSPLHLAALCGSTFAMKDLLDAGADPNQCDAHKRTPLHAAVAWGIFFLGTEACNLVTQRMARARRGVCAVAIRERHEEDMLCRRASASDAIDRDESHGRVRIVEPGSVGPSSSQNETLPLLRPVMPVTLARARSHSEVGALTTRYTLEEWRRQAVANYQVALLLKAGAHCHPRDENQKTPLQLAEQQHGSSSGFVIGLRRRFGQDDDVQVMVSPRGPCESSSLSDTSYSESPIWWRYGERDKRSITDDSTSTSSNSDDAEDSVSAGDPTT